jgi:hypothetical protein
MPSLENPIPTHPVVYTADNIMFTTLSLSWEYCLQQLHIYHQISNYVDIHKLTKQSSKLNHQTYPQHKSIPDRLTDHTRYISIWWRKETPHIYITKLWYSSTTTANTNITAVVGQCRKLGFQDKNQNTKPNKRSWYWNPRSESCHAEREVMIVLN